jgi:hypothetical protein
MKKHIIWSNNDLNYEDWKDDLEDYYPDATDDERYELMYDINDDYLYDERANLNISLNEDIIIIGDLGLWDGRRYGYKELNSNNIKDCLYSDCDFVTWYVDGYKNLRCIGYHHDGTNFYTYRMWKEGLTDVQKENFLDKIYEGKCTSRDISRYTRRIGDYIQEVYGWE